MDRSRALSLVCGVVACLSCSVAGLAQGPLDLRFAFGAGAPRAGYTRVPETSVYSDAAGFGFEPPQVLVDGNAPKRAGPIFFSVKVPEGNFDVLMTFAGLSQAATITVKAESGRLMLERVAVPAGQTVERRFTTNVRTPALPKLPLNATGREQVSLDPFDRANARDWDDRLTIEVDGPREALRSIEITPAPEAPTVYLAGDSTVTDRDGGYDVSWGQLLPRFLKPGVAVANEAQSGETLKSFANALRLDKILSGMKKGDYVFLQFGHNDSKASWPQTYAEAETTYQAYLKVYIAEARMRGATPVLVTPMDRGARGTGAPMHGHGAYPDAIREVAREEHVALIDLYAMSTRFYEGAGPDAAGILADGTHSTAYGGYEFAKCIALGIRQNRLSLAKFLVEDFGAFDPAHPDTPATLKMGEIFSEGPPASGNGAGSAAAKKKEQVGPGPL